MAKTTSYEFDALCRAILEAVGGSQNIATVFLAADDLVALLRRHGAIVDPIHV